MKKQACKIKLIGVSGILSENDNIYITFGHICVSNEVFFYFPLYAGETMCFKGKKMMCAVGDNILYRMGHVI